MNNRHLVPAALWLLSGALSACSEPSSRTFATFNVEDVSFKFPLPKGFCLPTGNNLKLAQGGLAFNNSNTILVTADRCQGNPFDATIFITTVNDAIPMLFNRKDLLDSLGAEFNKPETLALMDGGKLDEFSSKNLSKAFGPGIAVRTRLTPMGRDNICLYIGGPGAAYRNGDKLGFGFVGACTTVVKRKLIQITAAGRQEGGLNITELLVETKSIAQSLIDNNETD